MGTRVKIEQMKNKIIIVINAREKNMPKKIVIIGNNALTVTRRFTKKIYKTKQMHDEYTNKDKGNMADEIFHDNFLFG